eukprot:CAMPEP_0178442788 /NCGR_PEP_ID=MMETSP0689_2-20121128/38412_1 /TAXON_ID=160604 /ORGANISM="Amphidinium massartii, Strain CS-259" /LENGTH=44 /DNA_ID= /DNA_START= /DNA_END= /DNA_ORIENTATION=
MKKSSEPKTSDIPPAATSSHAMFSSGSSKAAMSMMSWRLGNVRM